MFGEIKNRLSGPERTFVIGSLERGEETIGTETLFSSCGWIMLASSHRIPVRRLVVELYADESRYQISTSEPLVDLKGESFDGLYPTRIQKLEELKEQPIIMRAKEPYDLGTLEKLLRRG